MNATMRLDCMYKFQATKNNLPITFYAKFTNNQPITAGEHYTLNPEDICLNAYKLVSGQVVIVKYLYLNILTYAFRK